MSPLARPSGRRRSRVLAVAAAVTSLALAGCAADGGGGEEEPEASPEASAEGDGAFPVTIEHALGTAVVEEQPERVVTLGWGSQDTVLALGITPVGVPSDGFAGDPETGLLPWTADAIEELGGEAPTTYVDLPEVDVQEIAALEPDLILATYSGISQEVYDQLSQLAPTVAYPETPWLVAWQDQTVINGRALGMEAEAEQLVTDTEALIAAAGEENPDLAGKTFAFVYASPEGELSAYVEGDPRVDLLVGLGMELAPAIAELEVPEGTFFADLGTENTDLLADVDVLVAWYNHADEQARVESLGTFAAIPAVERGSYLPVLDRQVSLAISTTTALSVPWVLERFVPELSEAAGAAG